MLGPLIIAVLTVAAGLCAVGVVGRNPVIGIRTPSFFASDEAWKLGHRVAVVPMAIAACVCIGLTFLAGALPAYNSAVALIVSLSVMLGGVVVGALMGARALRHIDQ